MKKSLFCLIFLAVYSINLVSGASNITNSNPIISFMQTESSSPLFKFIGAPEILTNQNLIIYLLGILIAFIIIKDILSTINLFDKKWIQASISLIVVLIGSYSGTSYKLIQTVTTMGFESAYLAAITPTIVLIIFIGYLIVRFIIKKIRLYRKTHFDKNSIDAQADKIKTLRKIQDIEAKARGIK